MSRELMRRAFSMEVRADEAEGRKIKGRAVVYGAESQPLWGEWREKIAAGAFRESLAAAGGNIFLLWQHDRSLPLASTASGDLIIRDTEQALEFEASLGDSDFESFAFSKIRKGTVNRMSFGFEIEEESVDYDAKTYVVTRANLFEISPVTWPAYTQSAVEARSFVESILSRKAPATSEANNNNSAALVELRLRQARERALRAN